MPQTSGKKLDVDGFPRHRNPVNSEVRGELDDPTKAKKIIEPLTFDCLINNGMSIYLHE